LGWKIIFAEQLSLTDQIKILSTATHIAGVHGAGLAGMIWMPKGSMVIELGPTRFVPCFSRLAEVSELRYQRIEYSDSPESGKLILDLITKVSP
jgi:capsular polysaccharide biosynthesis protein